MKKGVSARIPLTRKVLREIERELGVYLDNGPLRANRELNQQFAVYDEDERFVTDIVSETLYFTQEELISKIQSAFYP